MYLVLMNVSPWLPGLHLQLRSLVFRDQHVRLTGFSGGAICQIKIKRRGQHEYSKTYGKKKQAGSVHKLTANIKTWSSQHFSIASVANQVVSWPLQGAIELMECDAGFGRAKDLIRVSSQAFSIERPVQGSSCYFQLGANGAHCSQARADVKHWILGGYDSQVWGSEEEETSWFQQFYNWIYDRSWKGHFSAT